MDNSRELIFRRIWAFTHIFFLASSSDWIRDVFLLQPNAIFALVISALAITVVWSSNSKLFYSMLIVQICFAFYVLPDLQNHRSISALINIGLLLGFSDGKFFNSKTVWVIARSILIVYFFAAFHKLNYDFFDSKVSCGPRFLDHVKILFPQIWFSDSFVIYGTVLIEFLLVLLLLFPRTWKIAALSGIIFHIGLSFDYFKMFTNFSAVMCGLLSIAANPSPVENILFSQRALRSFSIILATAFCLVGFSIINNISYLFIVHSLFLIWCLGLIFLLFNSGSKYVVKVSRLGLIISSIFILNGIAPYLGIKNRGSYNMYSNLQISHEYSNHFLFKKGGDVLGFRGIQPPGFLGKLFPFNPSGPQERDKCVW